MGPRPAIGVSADALVGNCVLFCRLLREAGLGVAPDAAADVLTVAHRTGVADKAAFFHGTRALLTAHRTEWPVFEAVFHAFWRRHVDADRLEVQRPAGRGLDPVPARLPGARGPAPRGEGETGNRSAFGAHPAATQPARPGEEDRLAASWAEAHGARELRDLSPGELTSALRLLDPARALAPRRRLRRAAPGKGAMRFDLRASLRASARCSGELAELTFRDYRTEERRIILVCDTSRSMRPFTRAVLGLPYVLRQALSRVEVFFFSTQLTKATHLLARRSPDRVLHDLDLGVPDWGGGTRVGAALGAFNRDWARRVGTTGAVVVLLTDGLDAGDPVELAAEARALRQRCWRLVWLNPLAGGPGFEPKATGMAALLPEVDLMLPCRDLASLAHFLSVLGSFRGCRDLDPVLRPRLYPENRPSPR